MLRVRTFSFLFLIALLTTLTAAEAARYDIKEMTPQVQQAITARQNRYEELQQLKRSKSVGENNRGYVDARDSSQAAASLVESENADRRTIYQTIAEQNHLGAAGLTTLESVFSEVQRGKARSGDLLQFPSGEWTEKK